jgi:hypothetical protein
MFPAGCYTGLYRFGKERGEIQGAAAVNCPDLYAKIQLFVLPL